MKIYFNKSIFNVDDVWFYVTRKIEYRGGGFVLDKKAAEEVDLLIDADMNSHIITETSFPILCERLNRIIESVDNINAEIYGMTLNPESNEEPDNKGAAEAH